jgi:hypothetical protein
VGGDVVVFGADCPCTASKRFCGWAGIGLSDPTVRVKLVGALITGLESATCTTRDSTSAVPGVPERFPVNGFRDNQPPVFGELESVLHE